MKTNAPAATPSRSPYPIYWATRSLCFGPQPRGSDAERLRDAGITHIVRLTGAKSEFDSRAPLFREVAVVPVQDFMRIPTDVAYAGLNTLHRMAHGEGANAVLVHCYMGRHRSATLVWLYLIALGVSRDVATACVAAASTDNVFADRGLRDLAENSNGALTDDALVTAVIEHGAAAFRPYRPALLEAPAYRG